MKTFAEVFRSHRGRICNKWAQYVTAYDRELAPLLARRTPLRLLEIGVQSGGSIELWVDLLPEHSTVLGIDIDPACAELAFSGDVRVEIGDATDREFLDRILGGQEFDVIIDDGSHRSADIIAAFELLFPRLAAGGLYIIEDLHAGYWASFGGGWRAPGSAIEHLKALIDALHTDYVGGDPSIEEQDMALLRRRNREIARVSFVDSMAVIEKYARPKDGRFALLVAGSDVGAADRAWLDGVAGWSVPVIAMQEDAGAEIDRHMRTELTRMRRVVAEGAELRRPEQAAEIARLRLELAAAQDRTWKCRHRLDRVKRSLSWRLTRPIRRIRKWLVRRFR